MPTTCVKWLHVRMMPTWETSFGWLDSLVSFMANSLMVYTHRDFRTEVTFVGPYSLSPRLESCVVSGFEEVSYTFRVF